MTWNDRPAGSGWNGNRVKLRKILAGPQVSGIVVEHRDRRARFGVEHRQAAVAATGRRIIVVNPDEVTDDLVRDMTRGRGRRCVLAGMVAGLLVAALRRVSGALPPRR